MTRVPITLPVVGAVVLLGVASISYAWSSAANQRAPWALRTRAAETVIGVDQLMTGAIPPSGPVIVEGVVIATSSQQPQLSVIDTTEFEECGVGAIKCSTYLLPVAWEGEMPATNTRVRIRGSVQIVHDKFLFAATSIETPPVTEG